MVVVASRRRSEKVPTLSTLVVISEIWRLIFSSTGRYIKQFVAMSRGECCFLR